MGQLNPRSVEPEICPQPFPRKYDAPRSEDAWKRLISQVDWVVGLGYEASVEIRHLRNFQSRSTMSVSCQIELEM